MTKRRAAKRRGSPGLLSRLRRSVRGKRMGLRADARSYMLSRRRH